MMLICIPRNTVSANSHHYFLQCTLSFCTRRQDWEALCLEETIDLAIVRRFLYFHQFQDRKNSRSVTLT